MVWLNIDKLTKRCTLHSAPTCIYLQNKEETEYKGIGELKRHGGWLEFPNETEAREFFLAKFERYHWAKKIYYFTVAFIVIGGLISFSLFILEKFMG